MVPMRDNRITPRSSATDADWLRLPAILLLATLAMTTAVFGEEAVEAAALDELGAIVVLPDEFERDASGRPIVDGLPFVRPQREVQAADEAQIEPLKDERDRVVESARAARRLIELPDPRPDQLQAEIDAAKRNP